MDIIFKVLAEQWQYDVAVMSQPWMYYTVLPIMFYLVFFFAKWAVLTAPVWLPLAIIAAVARK